MDNLKIVIEDIDYMMRCADEISLRAFMAEVYVRLTKIRNQLGTSLSNISGDVDTTIYPDKLIMDELITGELSDE